jgi:hypothetical protein
MSHIHFDTCDKALAYLGDAGYEETRDRWAYIHPVTGREAEVRTPRHIQDGWKVEFKPGVAI